MKPASLAASEGRSQAHDELASGSALIPALPLLRPVAADDEPFLRDLYAAVRWPELERVAWTNEQKRAFCDMQFTLQDRQYREHYPQADLLVIIEEDARIGRLYSAKTGLELRLLDIALLPAVRGRGLGTFLLQALLAQAMREGRNVVLHVETDNPARRLYERLGFVAGETAGVYREMVWRPMRWSGPAPSGAA